MLMSGHSDMIQSSNAAAPYNAWKGQLYIHEQLVCDIALQAPKACSIPAQLSKKLNLKEAVRLSELRKKLPEDLFQKTDLTGQEVSCGNIYYNLYSVATSNIVGSELDKLLRCMKDQDLVFIKVLNDQGFLILVNSAVLQSNAGVSDGNSSAQLNALFLFPHQKSLDNKAREDWKGKFVRKELPSTISKLLPGLQYATAESRKLQKDKALYPGPLVEQYFRKYVVLQSKQDSSSERRPEKNEPPSVLYSHDEDLPKKCSQVAFSCLQLYFSSPVNFSVPLIKMTNILAENALSSNSDQYGKTVGNLVKQDNQSSASKQSLTAASKSDRIQGKRAVREDKEQNSKRGTKRKSVKRREPKSKRKSVQRAALTTAETGENRTASKRRRLQSEDKKQTGSSSEATVKLSSAPFSQRRKRGAEVLTAAFIQDEKIQTTEKIASSKTNEENKNLTKKTKAITRKPKKILAPEEHVPDRPPKRKASERGNKNMSAGVRNKPESVRRTSERKTGKGAKMSQEKIKNITVEQINTISKSSKSLRDVRKPSLSTQMSEESMIERRFSMYESHALNLLADLALNSFCSTEIPYLKSVPVASASESLVEEAAGTGDSITTVEHLPKDCIVPSPSSTFTEPERLLESESDKPKNGLNVSPRSIASHKRMENSDKQMSQKAHIAAAKAKARCNATSKISLEHSYSQLPMDDITGKSANEQPVQSVPDSTTPADLVLEPSTNALPGETVLLTSDNVCPATDRKQRAVSKSQETFRITFYREPKYDFDLDSKFTSDPIEKTINRALHGPWNPHLKENIEDVRLILHMWIALFYSKSNKQISCSSRKVVEHSNPAKYVSINTVLDPFEFYEFMESDDTYSAKNNNVILSMGKKFEAPHQVFPLESVFSCKSGKSESKRLQDFNVPSSIPTKDYNIKLTSEMFQMCKNSESALTVTCKMAPTSKGAQTPANVMKTISATNVPTVCYIGDTDLFNTALTDKSQHCMGIGGFSSEKAKETEHKYSRNFSGINKAKKSAALQMDCKVESSNVGEQEGNFKAYDTVSSAGRTSQTHGNFLALYDVTMPATTGDIHEITSKLRFANKERFAKKEEYFCAESQTIPTSVIPTAEDVNKDITHKNLTPMDLSSKSKETSADMGKEDALSTQSTSLSDARIPSSIDKTTAQTLLSQNVVQATILSPQGLPDCSAIADEAGDTEDGNNQMAITSSGGIESPSDRYDVASCVDRIANMVDPLTYGKALKCNTDSSGINHVGSDNLPTTESLHTNVRSKSIQSEDFRQVGEHTDNISSNLGPQKMTTEGLELCNSPNLSKNMDSNMNAEDNSNCSKEGKTDSTWDTVGLEDGQKKAIESISDEPGKQLESEKTHKLDENVLNEITAIEAMSRLQLNCSSDEASNVECTAKSCTTHHVKSGEQESINISLKESSKKTEGKEEHSIGEDEISTSLEPAMPVIYTDNSVVPETGQNVQETDVHEPGLISEESMVDKAENEVPEKPFLTLNVAHSCLSDDDADLLIVTDTDEETEESEPSIRDVSLNSDCEVGGLSETSKKEVPSAEEKAATDHTVPLEEESHHGACLVGEVSSAATDSCQLDMVASTSVFGDLNVEDTSKVCTMKVSVQCEKHKGHIHKGELAESQYHPLICQAPYDGEKIENNTCSVEIVNVEDDWSSKTKTTDISKDIIEGKSDFNDTNEKTQSDTTSSFSDLLMRKCSEMESAQQPVEKQLPDLDDDVYLSPTIKPTKTSAKDSTHSCRNSSSNKKEILSKLKRICLGSIPGHQVSSSSENVRSRDENSISGSFTKEKNEVLDITKNACPPDKVRSTAENCDVVVVVAEEPTIDSSPAEESAITVVHSFETVTPDEDKSTAENCDVVVEEPTIDKSSAKESAITIVRSFETVTPDEDKSTTENCDVVVAEEPTIDKCTAENCDVVVAEEPTIDNSPAKESAITIVHSFETVTPDKDKCIVANCDIVVAEEPTIDKGTVENCDVVVAEEPMIDNSPAKESAITIVHSFETVTPDKDKSTAENCDIVVAEEPTIDKVTVENCDVVVAEEPRIDNSLAEESAITIVHSFEMVTPEGVMPPQDICLISPSLEDVSDSIEQDPSPELPDICFIVNTGSISKEQYDRWSATSDEDIEYIPSCNEPPSHEEHLQKEILESRSVFLDKVKSSQEQTSTSRTQKCSKRKSGSNSGLHERDEYSSRRLQDLECKNVTNHGNVNVPKNIKDSGRAMRTINKESSCWPELEHLFSDRRMVSDDLTQKTLDMENVRFSCKLKEILRKSSTDKHMHEPPFQTMFESRRIPSCSHSTMKCRGPLLITMQCPNRRTDLRRHGSWHPSTSNSSPIYEDELWDRPVTYSRTTRKVRTQRYSPFHFSRLRYKNTLDKSDNDISVILNECVKSNHLKLTSIGSGSTAVDRTSATQLAEERGWQTRRMFVPVSSKSQTVKNMVSDLCMNLHSRLQNVARASEQKFCFYIYETDDGDFISSTKSLLVKEGHVPTDPRDFVNAEHSDSHQLLVIIRNEDVFSCINKIPYLMQLKLLPNVTFTGVDTPDDIMESTYEELFQAGGFVASDKSVLENITLGKLKDVLVLLEKMNRTSPWKWLIHYRENRKLKEDKRAEAVSQTKMSLLKSYQQSNVIEILPYHQCDSRSKEPSDDLSCLLNLQYQHIHSRLAVYLTDTTSMVTEEYEQNGILVYDVDTFLRKILKVDSQFQATYWS